MNRSILLITSFVIAGMMVSCGDEDGGEDSNDEQEAPKEVDRIGEAISDYCECTELPFDEIQSCMETLQKKYEDIQDDDEAQRRFREESRECTEAMNARMEEANGMAMDENMEISEEAQTMADEICECVDLPEINEVQECIEEWENTYPEVKDDPNLISEIEYAGRECFMRLQERARQMTEEQIKEAQEKMNEVKETAE